MKSLDISFNEDELKFGADDKKYLATVGYGGMFELLLNQGLTSQNSQGVPISKGIILGRIQRKLNSTDKVIELEEAEFDLIKEAFGHNARFAVTQFKLISVYLEKIEQAAKVLTSPA